MNDRRIRGQITSYRPLYKDGKSRKPPQDLAVVHKAGTDLADNGKYPLFEFDVIPDATASMFAQFDDCETKFIISIYGPTQSQSHASSQTQVQTSESSKDSETDFTGEFHCSFEFASYIIENESINDASSAINNYNNDMNEGGVNLVNEPRKRLISNKLGQKRNKSKLERKIESNIQSIFKYNILLTKYPKCRIDCFIYCIDYSRGRSYKSSIESGNLLLCNCINTVSIALMDARIELKDTVSSVYCQCFASRPQNENKSEYTFNIEPDLTGNTADDTGEDDIDLDEMESKTAQLCKDDLDDKKGDLVSDMTVCYLNAKQEVSLINMNGSLPVKECKEAMKQSVKQCAVIKYFMKQTMIQRFENKLAS